MPEIFTYLAHLLEHADEISVQRLRPYQLADYWKLPRREVLELFLYAARAGVLDLRWELLCPMCRGVSEGHESLRDVHNHSHCDYCNIDFSVNFDRQVEVVFRPNPAVRPLPANMVFCVAGPQSEPHVVVTKDLAVDEQVDVPTILEAGRFALSASGLGSELPVLVRPHGALDVEIPLEPAGWPEGELEIGTTPVFHLVNRTDSPQTVGLARTAWRDDAATAADVTSLQVFRNLFAREALGRDEEISIESVVLMFTDLRDSTRLYRQVGDALAFGRVRQHFDLLEQAVAEEGGAVVKTIGDAVMVVFHRPVMAFKAIWRAHAAIASAEGTPPLYTKVGIHTGACIAVTLNERLDYFGSAVNIAARLPGLSDGGEVIFSKEIFDDPSVQAWLQENQLRPQTFQSFVKGYEEPFEFWRLKL